MTPTLPRTSDAYQPAVMLCPDGTDRRVTVLRVRLDSVDAAREKLAAGRVAWVAVGDVSLIRSFESCGASPNAGE